MQSDSKSVLYVSMAETPKKIVGNNCFLCSITLIPTGKVRVFGKSSVDISGLIESAVEIDAKSNLRTVREEIKGDYKKGVLRTKRLRRDYVDSNFSIASIENSTVQQRCTAAKSLKFPNLFSTCTSSGF